MAKQAGSRDCLGIAPGVVGWLIKMRKSLNRIEGADFNEEPEAPIPKPGDGITYGRKRKKPGGLFTYGQERRRNQVSSLRTEAKRKTNVENLREREE